MFAGRVTRSDRHPVRSTQGARFGCGARRWPRLPGSVGAAADQVYGQAVRCTFSSVARNQIRRPGVYARVTVPGPARATDQEVLAE